MLDPRLYRLAFVPVLLALLVAAFSLETRPRPIGTTLAPDAFDGRRATATLDRLVREFPDRRAGDVGDERLAVQIARELQVLGRGAVQLQRFEGETIDGKRDLVNVVAVRPGAPGPGIVVVAHRDAAGREARAELSGTAALLELARVAGEARLQRTITFVSTTGGSGGAAGAREAARELKRTRPAAVLVLGDIANERVRKPFVVGWSNGRGQAPLRLRRTVEAAVREEAATDPGGPRAAAQWARLAAPLTVGEQGALGREGLPAVLIQVSGERGPAPGDATAPGRLEAFGRAALRTIYAIDKGPVAPERPRAAIVTQNKVLPPWAVRLLVGMLLLPPLLAVVDGWARLRRRGEAVARWAIWTGAAALPFAVCCVFLLALAAVGLLTVAPGAPMPAEALSVDGAARAALIGVLCVLALGWVALRPVLLRLLGPRERPAAGAAIGVLLSACVVATVIWALNPHAAALFVPALHCWLVALAPEARMPRVVAAALVVVPLVVPLAALAMADATALGLGPLEATWFIALLVAGGHAGLLAWLLASAVAGCGAAALVVAARLRRDAAGAPNEVTVRGPVTYAGPGSLGGTESALRR